MLIECTTQLQELEDLVTKVFPLERIEYPVDYPGVVFHSSHQNQVHMLKVEIQWELYISCSYSYWDSSPKEVLTPMGPFTVEGTWKSILSFKGHCSRFDEIGWYLLTVKALQCKQ